VSAHPPRIACRLLALALGGDPAGPAILGDLQEDFAAVARERGPAAARWWYRREALRLALGRISERLVGPSSGVRRAPSTLLATLNQDAGYALRSLRGSPGFALFTAAVIGLGIGAAASVFGVLEPLVLAPLPFDNPEQLVWIANEAEPGDNSLSAVTSRSANLKDFRERSESFVALSGYNAFFDHAAYTLEGLGEPERLVGADVAPNLLDVLGVQPLYGRNFSEEEGKLGGPAAVILAHGFWQRRFGGDPGIVGRTLDLGGKPRTVIGVLPPTFDFSSVFSPGVRVDFLLPFSVVGADDLDAFQGNTLVIIGRLGRGETVASAQAELDGILVALGEEQRDRWGLGAVVTPLQQHLAGPFRPAFLLLAAAAATLLLIVCVNVSNMILARSPSRARELAVRKALGAPRSRLVRQLVLETLAIALAGSVLGSGIAWSVTRFVAATAAARVPLAADIGVNGAVLLFAVAAALVTGLLVGLVPALQVAEGGEATVLRGGGSGGTSRRAHRVREALVVVEITLACVLLVVGGLLVRSFRAVLDVDLGFDASNAVAWQLDPGMRFPTATAAADYFAAITDRVAAVPGVEAVGLNDALPLGRNRNWPYRVVGSVEDDRGDNAAYPHLVDPGYLPTMRVALVAGRNFTADDTEGTRPVVLLNESGARRIFGGEPALGRLLRFWGQWEWEVIGIVQDVRHLSPEMDAGVEAYFPVAQMNDFHTLDMVVRSRLPVPQVADAVAAAVAEVAPSVPMHEFWTVESTVDRALATRRFTLAVLSAFALAALLLAGLGIYGVLAHSVAERRREIGIRMALGASSARVMRGVMGRTLLLAGTGVAVGALLALWTARLLGSLLFGVNATDPRTFAATAMVVVLVAAAAALLPARRAARNGAAALRDV
jgi:predicted permease